MFIFLIIYIAAAGDIPTIEVLAATSILRSHLSNLRIRVINIVDLMKLQPTSEHPHGLNDDEYNSLFTKEKQIIMAFHGYPWLIHRLTYRRENPNLHVRGYVEEGSITTAFDMTVVNRMDRFHLVMDVIHRLDLQTQQAQALKILMETKLIQHVKYINENGVDMPEIVEWRWS